MEPKRKPPEGVPLKLFFEQHHLLQLNLRHMREAITALETQKTASGEKSLGQIRSSLRDVRDYFHHTFSEHQQYEEEVLFPRLMPRLLPEEKMMLAELAGEHAALQELIGRLSQAISSVLAHDSPPAEEVQTLRKFAHSLKINIQRHESVEDRIIAPLAAKLLSDNDILEIGQELKRRKKTAA